MDQPEDLPPLEIEIVVDTGPVVSALRRTQSTVTFAYHPDLTALDRELDNTYGGTP